MCSNLSSRYHHFPLHWASANGHVFEVNRLIQAGGDVNEQTEDGSTTLHAASENGHAEVVNILIQAGAEVNTQIKDGLWKGATPLHRASSEGHVEVITALLAAGADKTLKDGWDRTPHDVARNPDCKDALE